MRDYGARVELCGRHPADHDRMGPWHGTVAAEALVLRHDETFHIDASAAA
jgi:hypothetical protein